MHNHFLHTHQYFHVYPKCQGMCIIQHTIVGSEKCSLLGRIRCVGRAHNAAFKLLTSVWCLLAIICDNVCCIADINACIPSILIVYHTVSIYDSMD